MSCKDHIYETLPDKSKICFKCDDRLPPPPKKPILLVRAPSIFKQCEMEHRCFCGNPTRYWAKKKDVAKHDLSDVPEKAAWCARERKKRVTKANSKT